MSELALDHDGRTYSPRNAYWLGRAAALAYEDEDAIRSEVANWGLSHCDVWSIEDTEAFLAANESSIVLAFRGTEPTDVDDWASDLQIKLVRGPAGRVHEGFQLALGYVWPRVHAAILKQRESGGRKNLWVTGHSLGAAIATLAVAKLRLEQQHPVDGLYTYGHPRTGDPDFAQAFDSNMGNRTYRVVNNNDVVPRVPPRKMGYSHVGEVVYFDSDGIRRDDMSWWDKLMDRIEGRIDDLLKPGTDGMKDHSMSNYLACLKRDLPAA